MEAYSATPNYNPHVESYRPKSPQRANTPPSDTNHGDSSPRSVSFGRTIKREEEKDKRQKFLTARYGQHQMMLIRKRLAVEDWLYEKLRDLYNCRVSCFYFILFNLMFLNCTIICIPIQVGEQSTLFPNINADEN